MKLSVVIPSVNDPYLEKTVKDIRDTFETEYEVIVVFDGYGGNVAGVRALYHNEQMGLRRTVNDGVAVAAGEYILKVDEHCRFDRGFDRKLLAEIEDDWIVVPRRYELDVDRWEVMDTSPTDYDRLVTDNPDKIGGVKWRSRARDRRDILLDETMTFQGSCYLMSRKHWDWLGGLHEEGYGKFAQEAIELSLKTWLGGGRVMVNKNTWYAHKHRKFGRVVAPSGVRHGNRYSKDYWLNNKWPDRVHDLNWLMRRFGLHQ